MPHITTPNFTTFQSRVLAWFLDCFRSKHGGLTSDKSKRHINHRFLEEALELVQACDCTEAEAMAVVTYVYKRSKGEKAQEVGGVGTSLAVLCSAHGIDLIQSVETEYARIITMVEVIRNKENLKPTFEDIS